MVFSLGFYRYFPVNDSEIDSVIDRFDLIKMTAAILPALLVLGYFAPAESILCYQCNSTDLTEPFQCRENMPDDNDLVPLSCDEVYNARYCIKHTGRFEAEGILCYQCSAPNNTDCSDLLIHDRDGSSIHLKSCDHIFEARFCIKATGNNNGGVGTRRYCSSVDMGNYCNYIKQPGDQREYRSCVYTCDTDGCNAADGRTCSIITLILTSATLVLLNRT